LHTDDVTNFVKYPGLKALGHPTQILRDVLQRIKVRHFIWFYYWFFDWIICLKTKKIQQVTENLNVTGTLCEGESTMLMISR